MYLVFLGAPGAGKGTQAALVSRELGLEHISSGDLFRDALNRGTELGLKAQKYMTRGELVPDEITIGMVLERLAAPDCRNGVILDGFPRNLGQAKALDEAFIARGEAIDKAVYIKVSEEELISRLGGRWVCRKCQAPYHLTGSPPRVAGVCDKCGGELYQRPDDMPETVKNRLRVYFEQTAPLIAHYAGMGKLVEVAGEGTPAEITRRIVSAIDKSRKR
ncbi:MAG: adenylate kinase [Dehalococcoidia bacterium]|nr:MAG: adenylate kinase [Dehalococcoidia bacterium]